MLVLVVTLNFGRGSHAHRVDPRPKLFWLVNPTHGWVKPAKSRQNPRYCLSPSVCLMCGHSVNVFDLFTIELMLHTVLFYEMSKISQKATS